jgi:hypothetical protein
MFKSGWFRFQGFVVLYVGFRDVGSGYGLRIFRP